MSFKSRRATIKKNVSERVNPGWEALKAPNVRWLWTGQIISQIGEGLNKVALLWLVYTLTGSTLKMSEIGVLQTLPPMILGPLMGVYVDRFPKRLIMIGVDLARAALAVVIPILSVLNELTMFRLYAVVFVMAIVSTIFSPALSSTVPLIVDQKQLTATNALVNSTAMVGMLIGPSQRSWDRDDRNRERAVCKRGHLSIVRAVFVAVEDSPSTGGNEHDEVWRLICQRPQGRASTGLCQAPDNPDVGRSRFCL